MRGAKSAKWVAAAIVVATAATACGSSDDSSGSGGGGGGNVVRASWADPQNPLEPANTNEVQGGKVLDMIFEGLKVYNPKTGAAEDAMAESIDSKDQQNFTIKVKDGYKFSDGTAVTAKSYVDAWNYGALVTNKQNSSYFFSDIKGYDEVHPADETSKPSAKTMSGLKLVDDSTFTVALKTKASTWPERLGYKAFAPLPEMFFTDHAAYLAKPVGNGPYKVDSYTKGTGLKLSVNENYGGESKPANDGVELKVYTDNNTAYNDLQAGNIDLVDDIPAAQLGNAESDLQGRFINQPAGIIQTVSFPLYKGEWNKPGMEKVRQGLSMAIDREAITKQIFQGSRTPASDLTSPAIGVDGGFKEGLAGDTVKYDPAKAKALITEGGGIPGGKFTISSNADTGSHKDWIDAVCNSINKTMGDNVCTANMVGTFGDFRNQVVNEKIDGLFRTGWQMDYPLIENFITPLYTTNGSSNDAKYSNPKVDQLVAQANAEPDTKKAISLFQDAERQVIADMPIIPLWYQNGTAGYSDRVENVQLNPFSVPVFTDITVK
ncbi:Oligopeptide-binding protein OppA [Streptomyces sp. RB5]|uniref:Oligopeptide-binding protein OppA n=1 Tax=Streptomyces smaragdinus TaxID=2585196 RepID=A0A7K0CJQ9_9ACTN|nr:ABC transporter substrate-binding protein [Streptomyces smaragdinus]MQY13563.1 Oligopeptide-binding protein OppA [Streptomyces smaragdinus]